MAPWARAGDHGFRGGTCGGAAVWPCGRLEGSRGAVPAARVGRRGRRLLQALLAGASTVAGHPGGAGFPGTRRLHCRHLPGLGGGGSGQPGGSWHSSALTRAVFGARPAPEAPFRRLGAPRRGRSVAAWLCRREDARTGRWRWRGPRSGSSGNAEPSELPALFKESPDVSRAGPPSPRRARGPGPPPAPPLFYSSQGQHRSSLPPCGLLP